MEPLCNSHDWCVPTGYLKFVDPDGLLGQLYRRVLVECPHDAEDQEVIY